MLCSSRSLTVLGKAACISRKRIDATFWRRHASLILWMTRCIASVVHLPGRPPNCVAGSRRCFSVRCERSAATSVEKSFPRVSRRPMGR